MKKLLSMPNCHIHWYFKHTVKFAYEMCLKLIMDNTIAFKKLLACMTNFSKIFQKKVVLFEKHVVHISKEKCMGDWPTYFLQTQHFGFLKGYLANTVNSSLTDSWFHHCVVSLFCLSYNLSLPDKKERSISTITNVVKELLRQLLI